MIIIPERSINSRYVKVNTLCDWIEASVAFSDYELSSNDIVDVLLEEEICNSQDSAYQMVMDAFIELEQRAQWIGEGYAFKINGEWIRVKQEWFSSPAYSFCLLLSLAPHYSWWFKQFGSDYTEQGEIFELLTKESLQAQFTNWEIYQTGWTRTNTAGLQNVVNEVALRLGEIPPSSLYPFDSKNKKESGLDLLCYRPFPDNRSGIAVYLLQCASGGNLEDKIDKPNLDEWIYMLRCTNQLNRAVSTPFSLEKREFADAVIKVKGLLLDRCRLMRASQHITNWLPDTLENRIVNWSTPRIKEILKRS